MSEQTPRSDRHPWEGMDANRVLEAILHDLYGPVSLLGNQLHRLTGEDDPLTEDEYEAIIVQMDEAVRHLSMMVVHLKQYALDHGKQKEAERSA